MAPTTHSVVAFLSLAVSIRALPAGLQNRQGGILLPPQQSISWDNGGAPEPTEEPQEPIFPRSNSDYISLGQVSGWISWDGPGPTPTPTPKPESTSKPKPTHTSESSSTPEPEYPGYPAVSSTPVWVKSSLASSLASTAIASSWVVSSSTPVWSTYETPKPSSVATSSQQPEYTPWAPSSVASSSEKPAYTPWAPSSIVVSSVASASSKQPEYTPWAPSSIGTSSVASASSKQPEHTPWAPSSIAVSSIASSSSKQPEYTPWAPSSIATSSTTAASSTQPEYTPWTPSPSPSTSSTTKSTWTPTPSSPKPTPEPTHKPTPAQPSDEISLGQPSFYVSWGKRAAASETDTIGLEIPTASLNFPVPSPPTYFSWGKRQDEADPTDTADPDYPEPTAAPQQSDDVGVGEPTETVIWG